MKEMTFIRCGQHKYPLQSMLHIACKAVLLIICNSCFYSTKWGNYDEAFFSAGMESCDRILGN
jgi:hypothetical protein